MWENLWTLDLHFLHEEIPSISHPFQYSFLCAWWKVKNAIENPMAFGTGKGCWYFTSAPFILPVFDFLTSHRVPCLWKHWFYWTISCFLIRRRGKVSSFFMPRQRMKPSGAGNRIRPPPVAGEGSMRFCEKQVVQANAQKHADFEQRQEGRGLLREIRSLKPE